MFVEFVCGIMERGTNVFFRSPVRAFWPRAAEARQVRKGETAMYIIIETEHGLTVQRQPDAMTAAQVAAEHGGILVDDTAYQSYEDASEALFVFEQELYEQAESEERF